ncbi:MAG: Crp/Fnr family transcriptional regulator [Anaerolineales bacterium]|nr:Crp/Fnr family transcriptional regulator [Anaerolineales bacterium]
MSSQPVSSALLTLLAKISYFSHLDETLRKEIARYALRRDYTGDEIIFLEGDPCQGLYLVETGWLKVFKLARTGREQVLHFLGPGETFNALSVFTDAPNPATVMALEPSTVWLIRRETMLKLLETHPPLARMVIQDLAGRLLHMISLVEDISLRPVEGRLARFLLEQAEADTVQRRRWATQAEKAARLGTVPDVFNRALRKLVEAGLIEVSRHQIRILDADRLQKLAQGGE